MNMIPSSDWRINKDHALEEHFLPHSEMNFFCSGNLVSAGELLTWRRPMTQARLASAGLGFCPYSTYMRTGFSSIVVMIP